MPNRKQAMLRDFHRKYGHVMNDLPTEIDGPTRILRAKLVFTEALEFCRALGVQVAAGSRYLHGAAPIVSHMEDDQFEFGLVEESITGRMWGLKGGINWIELADAIADLNYVITGTEEAVGMDCDPAFDEVHRSNMSKSADKDKHGKTIKGPDYSPPDIKSVLDFHYPSRRHLWEKK